MGAPRVFAQRTKTPQSPSQPLLWRDPPPTNGIERGWVIQTRKEVHSAGTQTIRTEDGLRAPTPHFTEEETEV